MSDYVNVVFNVDDAFMPHAGVCVTSLLRNTSHRKFRFTFLNRGISPRNKFFMSLVVRENSKESVVEYLDMNNRMLNPILADRWKEEIYYRFFIPDLFPNEDKILYLDSDTLVLSDIMELFEKDLGDHPFAAATDVYDSKIMDIATKKVMNFNEYLSDWLEIPLEQHSRYFNSGVLLMNLNVMRKQDRSGIMSDLAHKKNFAYPDQDILNIFHVSEYMELERTWNYPAWTYSGEEIDVNIIHFVGEGKPWIYGPPVWELGFAPFGYDIYYKYLRSTPWLEQVIAGIDRNKLKELLGK